MSGKSLSILRSSRIKQQHDITMLHREKRQTDIVKVAVAVGLHNRTERQTKFQSGA